MFVAGFTLFGERWCSPSVAQESRIAATTATAFGCEVPIALVHQVGEHHAARVFHHRAFGNGHDEILAAAPVPALALTVRAARGPSVRVVAEAEERCDIAVSDEPDVAAVAAITTVGAAFGDVGFTTECDRARTAISGLHMEATLVDEAGHPCRLRAGARKPGAT